MLRLDSLNPLFVFEMANNHMGSVEHGIRIIKEFSHISGEFPFKFGFKLQYRQLDTFIHPEYRGRNDFKYVKRFSETRLSPDQYRRLKDEIKKHGFVAICTPFDQESVDLIEEHKFDIIKIASCSFTDWPLLERIVLSEKPVIASTAGVPLLDIDKVVSFLEHRKKDFALMHCVAQYPTPAVHLQLNQIDVLKSRYPKVRIGYSTHEAPDELDSVKVAVGKGVTLFEKHVGMPDPDKGFGLNDYSANPSQAYQWLTSARAAFKMCGVCGKRAEFSNGELTSLRSLRRGLFACRSFKAGERIPHDAVFAAIPTLDQHITANDLSKYAEVYALRDIEANEPLLSSNAVIRNVREEVYKIVQQVKQLLKSSGVTIPSQVDLEISHHYGIDRFFEHGLTMLTVINRAYCKKLIVLLPGQKHPTQYHEQKEETFHVLYGEVDIELDGIPRKLGGGETVTVERGVRHYFGSETGAVIEEISSTHSPNDSFYLDPAIAKNKNRKTMLTYWFD